jgi:hypothetical protein
VASLASPSTTADYLEEQKGTLLEDPAVALVVAANVEPARRPVEEVELGHRHQRNHAGPELAPGEDRPAATAA